LYRHLDKALRTLAKKISEYTYKEARGDSELQLFRICSILLSKWGNT
jgi:hypothetical protein